MKKTLDEKLSTPGGRSGLSRSLNNLYKATFSDFEPINAIIGVTEDHMKELVELGLAETGTSSYEKFGYKISGFGEQIRNGLKAGKWKEPHTRVKEAPPMVGTLPLYK